MDALLGENREEITLFLCVYILNNVCVCVCVYALMRISLEEQHMVKASVILQ